MLNTWNSRSWMKIESHRWVDSFIHFYFCLLCIGKVPQPLRHCVLLIWKICVAKLFHVNIFYGLELPMKLSNSKLIPWYQYIQRFDAWFNDNMWNSHKWKRTVEQCKDTVAVKDEQVLNFENVVTCWPHVTCRYHWSCFTVKLYAWKCADSNEWRYHSL